MGPYKNGKDWEEVEGEVKPHPWWKFWKKNTPPIAVPLEERLNGDNLTEEQENKIGKKSKEIKKAVKNEKIKKYLMRGFKAAVVTTIASIVYLGISWFYKDSGKRNAFLDNFCKPGIYLFEGINPFSSDAKTQFLKKAGINDADNLEKYSLYDVKWVRDQGISDAKKIAYLLDNCSVTDLEEILKTGLNMKEILDLRISSSDYLKKIIDLEKEGLTRDEIKTIWQKKYTVKETQNIIQKLKDAGIEEKADFLIKDYSFKFIDKIKKNSLFKLEKDHINELIKKYDAKIIEQSFDKKDSKIDVNFLIDFMRFNKNPQDYIKNKNFKELTEKYFPRLDYLDLISLTDIKEKDKFSFERIEEILKKHKNFSLNQIRTILDMPFDLEKPLINLLEQIKSTNSSTLISYYSKVIDDIRASFKNEVAYSDNYEKKIWDYEIKINKIKNKLYNKDLIEIMRELDKKKILFPESITEKVMDLSQKNLETGKDAFKKITNSSFIETLIFYLKNVINDEKIIDEISKLSEKYKGQDAETMRSIAKSITAVAKRKDLLSKTLTFYENLPKKNKEIMNSIAETIQKFEWADTCRIDDESYFKEILKVFEKYSKHNDHTLKTIIYLVNRKLKKRFGDFDFCEFYSNIEQAVKKLEEKYKDHDEITVKSIAESIIIPVQTKKQIEKVNKLIETYIETEPAIKNLEEKYQNHNDLIVEEIILSLAPPNLYYYLGMEDSLFREEYQKKITETTKKKLTELINLYIETEPAIKEFGNKYQKHKKETIQIAAESITAVAKKTKDRNLIEKISNLYEQYEKHNNNIIENLSKTIIKLTEETEDKEKVNKLIETYTETEPAIKKLEDAYQGNAQNIFLDEVFGESATTLAEEINDKNTIIKTCEVYAKFKKYNYNIPKTMANTIIYQAKKTKDKEIINKLCETFESYTEKEQEFIESRLDAIEYWGKRESKEKFMKMLNNWKK